MRHFRGGRLITGLLALAGVCTAPFAQAQSWSPITGDFQGGAVRSHFDSSTGDSWLAIYGAGMYRRAPGGTTWVPMNNGLTDKRVFSLNLTTGVNPYRGYAPTMGGGLFKTVDGGANWTAVNNGLGCLTVRSVSFIGLTAASNSGTSTNGVGASASTDRLLVSTECATNGGVYLSTDSGANWSLTTGIPTDVLAQNVTRVTASGVDFLVAATYSGVYKSTDNGLTWTASSGAITSPYGPNINNVTFLNTPAFGLALFAAEANTGVWKSTDQGATWTLTAMNKITTGGISTDGNTNGNLYYPVDGEGIYKSGDGGATWTLFASAAVVPGPSGLTRDTSTSGSPKFFARTFAGLYTSTDSGSTWKKDSAGLPGGFVIHSVDDSSGNSYVPAADGVYKLPPGGSTFQRIGGGNLGNFFSGGHLSITSADVLYALTSRLGVFKFDGTNWVAKNNGLPNMTRRVGNLRADPKNPAGLYLGLMRGGGMYYSSNGGDTWVAKNSGLAGDALNIRTVDVTSNFTVIGTEDGVYKSVDSGTNWTRLPFPAKDPNNLELPISKLRIDSGNGYIYASLFQGSPLSVPYPASGVWKSADGGNTWTQLLSGKLVREIRLARSSAGVTLYAGVWDASSGGALQSTDDGATWTAINNGLPTIFIQNFGTTGGELKSALTLGDGFFKFTPPVAPETLRLVSGWNLLGNGMSTAITVASAFKDASKISTVWKWLPASANWAFYTPSIADGGAVYAASKGYAFLTSIAAGEGFWVNATGAVSAPLAGTAVASTSFRTTLASGWSLLATGDRPTPSAFNRLINNSVTPPTPGVVPTSVTSLWGWEPTKANWYFYAPSLEANGGLAAYIASKNYLDFGELVLEPAAGFWVNKP